jgi:hypothetical protein
MTLGVKLKQHKTARDLIRVPSLRLTLGTAQPNAFIQTQTQTSTQKAEGQPTLCQSQLRPFSLQLAVT